MSQKVGTIHWINPHDIKKIQNNCLFWLITFKYSQLQKIDFFFVMTCICTLNQTRLSKFKMPFSIKQNPRKTIWHFHWSKQPNYLKSLKQVLEKKTRMVLDFFVKGAHRVWRLYQKQQSSHHACHIGSYSSILIQSFLFLLFIYVIPFI